MRISFTIALFFLAFHASAQDSLEKKKDWQLSGYLKELAWVRSDKLFTKFYVTDLIHNRLNLKWRSGHALTGRLEIRNRFYWGDEIKIQTDFKPQLENKGEAADLSFLLVDQKSMILHSNVERLWLDYRVSKWNMRVGRQRVNWGMANSWNPNDIFNSYNFLDFDYEERPGSDAVKAQYLFNDHSNMEGVLSVGGKKTIVAGRYFTNFEKFDMQWNAGVYHDHFTAGFGWAGNIKNAGFKGELQYHANRDSINSRLLFTLETDYMFESGLYLSAAMLFDENGFSHPLREGEMLSFQPSPRKLMPTRWNIMISGSREFTPRLAASLNLIYSPGVQLIIFVPSLKYNIRTNLDFDLVWQSFFAETNRFQAFSHWAFFRLKWSY